MLVRNVITIYFTLRTDVQMHQLDQMMPYVAVMLEIYRQELRHLTPGKNNSMKTKMQIQINQFVVRLEDQD